MTYTENPERYEAKLRSKLRPETIRSTLAFAGLFQITHEMIKKAVLVEVCEFYAHGFDGNGTTYDEEAYAAGVLKFHPKNRFKASLERLIEMEAITSEQAARLDDIYGTSTPDDARAHQVCGRS